MGKEFSNYSTIAKHCISLPGIFKKPTQLTVVKENDNKGNTTFDWLHKFHNKPTTQMRPFRETRDIHFSSVYCLYNMMPYCPWWSAVNKNEIKVLPGTSHLTFATAVPDPMAIPISAFFSAGASLTPSPVIATYKIYCVFNNVGDK